MYGLGIYQILIFLVIAAFGLAVIAGIVAVVVVAMRGGNRNED